MQTHLESRERLLMTAGIRADKGLTQAQIDESREKNGTNALTKTKKRGIGGRVLDSVKEPMMILLLAAGLITLIINIVRAATGGGADFFECVGIFAAIMLSVVISVFMEGKSARAFELLNSIHDETLVKVLREGEIRLIPLHELVVGDIVCLASGDKVPADGRLLDAAALASDESSLTGESAPVNKNAEASAMTDTTPIAERKNMMYSGCFVTGGNGRMIVTAVGDNTEFGRIARELSASGKTSTPLQEKLAKLGKTITILGISASLVVFAVQICFLFFNGAANMQSVSDVFITSIVLIVAVVPEGLPTIVAVSFSINVIKMARQNALVKKMIACETIGCVNVICSDKTGTLTQNKMTVQEVFAADRGLIKPKQLQNEDLIQNFCVNSTADLRALEKSVEFIGSPTECALLGAAGKAGRDYRLERSRAEIAHVYPFSSEAKYMTTVVKRGGEYVLYAKGSPERILSMCDTDGRKLQAVNEKIMTAQRAACRVIAFGHKVISARPQNYETERGTMESGMVFDGFVAINDPLRPDVRVAAKRCREAGIDLKILTGDNILTASAIAKELGILDAQHVALEAYAVDAMSDEELSARLDGIRVIARSAPATKMRIVNLLKAKGCVVAVTGDGINDAPAIKNADVGISMGITGTEVSKEASDIVLLDDSFATIVKAVEWGRGIYENFQRFIQFQLTVNLSSVVVVIVSILIGFDSPFTALQLLWINIIMDGPPALTLGLEPNRPGLMGRKPTRRGSGIVTAGMLFRILFNGALISGIFLLQKFCNFLGASEAEMPTVLFTLFVVCQLFNSFHCRELGTSSIFSNFFKNKWMLVVLAVTFYLQFVITQFGGAFFGTVALSTTMWLKLTGAAACVILLSEVGRLIHALLRRTRKKAFWARRIKLGAQQ